MIVTHRKHSCSFFYLIWVLSPTFKSEKQFALTRRISANSSIVQQWILAVHNQSPMRLRTSASASLSVHCCLRHEVPRTPREAASCRFHAVNGRVYVRHRVRHCASVAADVMKYRERRARLPQTTSSRVSISLGISVDLRGHASVATGARRLAVVARRVELAPGAHVTAVAVAAAAAAGAGAAPVHVGCRLVAPQPAVG